MARGTVILSASVEGIVDEAVYRRLARSAGADPGLVYGRNGKADLKERIGGYNAAASHSPWVVFVDLDHDADCAPELRKTWLPDPSRLMCFRVAVREVESWLLADRERIAPFLGVSPVHVPLDPDCLDDPKQRLIEIARRSHRRAVREDMAPRPGSGRSEGPAYASRIIEFTASLWRSEVAAVYSDSLHRCRMRLEELVKECS